jgi:hypothetical protein
VKDKRLFHVNWVGLFRAVCLKTRIKKIIKGKANMELESAAKQNGYEKNHF